MSVCIFNRTSCECENKAFLFRGCFLVSKHGKELMRKRNNKTSGGNRGKRMIMGIYTKKDTVKISKKEILQILCVISSSFPFTINLVVNYMRKEFENTFSRHWNSCNGLIQKNETRRRVKDVNNYVVKNYEARKAKSNYFSVVHRHFNIQRHNTQPAIKSSAL